MFLQIEASCCSGHGAYDRIEIIIIHAPEIDIDGEGEGGPLTVTDLLGVADIEGVMEGSGDLVQETELVMEIVGVIDDESDTVGDEVGVSDEDLVLVGVSVIHTNIFKFMAHPTELTTSSKTQVNQYESLA